MPDNAMTKKSRALNRDMIRLLFKLS